jgi:hypothetical protein
VPGPIFIVGPARSGTELTRSVLNGHPSLHIGVETHYFDDLRPRLSSPSTPSNDVELRQTLDYFRALMHRPYGLGGRPEDSPVTDAMLLDRAGGPTPSADAIFAAHCQLQSEGRTKPCWGEKTPRHLFRVADILAAFPEAKILVSIRDPRGVVASYRDWRNNWYGSETDGALRDAISAEERRTRRSYSLTLNSLLWRSAVQTALRLTARHGSERVFLLKFEDLLAHPELTVRRIADWAGLPYDPAMLAVSVTNSSYAAAGSVGSFDPRSARRWRETLSLAEIAHVELLTGHTMRALGYEPSAARIDWLFTGRELAAAPFQFARAIGANRSRIAGLPRYLLSRAAGLRQS